jgi:hypothetical protein
MAKITNYNIFVVLFAMLGGFSYGFAFSVFATSIGEPGFYLYFSLDRKFHCAHSPWPHVA